MNLSQTWKELAAQFGFEDHPADKPIILGDFRISWYLLADGKGIWRLFGDAVFVQQDILPQPPSLGVRYVAEDILTEIFDYCRREQLTKPIEFGGFTINAGPFRSIQVGHMFGFGTEESDSAQVAKAFLDVIKWFNKHTKKTSTSTNSCCKVELENRDKVIKELREENACLKEDTFARYSEQAAATAEYPDTLSALAYCVLGINGEAGEVAEKYKKIHRDERGLINEEHRRAMLEELGDVLWYVDRAAALLGSSLAEVAKINNDKLASRKARGKIHGDGDKR